MHQAHILLLFCNSYNSGIHHAVAQYAGKAHWHLSLLTHLEDKPIQGLRSIQGAIIADRFGPQVIHSLKVSGIPTVSLSYDPPEYTGPRVTANQTQIGQLAAEYFLKRNHHNFAYFGEPNNTASRLRLEAYTQALNAKGHHVRIIEPFNEITGTTLDWDAELQQLGRQLRKLPSPAAVFCYSDLFASRLLDAALTVGRLVPEEISILGVDDNSLICENVPAPLSSIRHPSLEIATQAASLLDECIAKKHSYPIHLTLSPVGITSRRSTDFFAVDHPRLREALLYIDRHYLGPLCLPEAAAAVELSPRGLQNLLKQQLDSSFTAEVLKRRITQAQRLLADAQLPISEIAMASGFTSSANFHQSFKAQTGQTPLQYRRMLDQTSVA